VFRNTNKRASDLPFEKYKEAARFCYTFEKVQRGGPVESKGGYKLRVLREALGCTMRDVENASLEIARRLGSEEFGIPPSRLSDIETKGVVPSVFRFYSLAAIYRRDYRELLSWYGVDLNDIHLDVGAAHPPSSHVSNAFESIAQISIPVRLDPGFNLQTTTNFGRMIEKWGVVPLSYLSAFAADDRYSYGYIGTEDFTMYPILPPGDRRRMAHGVRAPHLFHRDPRGFCLFLVPSAAGEHCAATAPLVACTRPHPAASPRG
jgi:transcriptional regulator with XRE-family HTH domain